MPDITNAYIWAVECCNAPNTGYSQAYRNAKTVGGVIYYDCSSFINYALIAGGFSTPQYAPANNAFTTYSMESVLLSLGFIQLPLLDEWKPGDIIVSNPDVTNHTEMVYQGRITMGAHSARYPLPDQVSINTLPAELPGYWRNCYRYGSGASNNYQWIKGNRYLDVTERQNNAFIIYSYLSLKGWSLNAISGMLGSMETESTINPGIWQNLVPNPVSGWGLVQWTPSTNFTDWAIDNGHEADSGDAQLKWIDEETVPTGQWIPVAPYFMSFDDFKKSPLTPEYLASAFLKNFERAGVEKEQERRMQARKWYNYLKTQNPWIPPVEDDTYKKLPFYMYPSFNKL